MLSWSSSIIDCIIYLLQVLDKLISSDKEIQKLVEVGMYVDVKSAQFLDLLIELVVLHVMILL